LNRRLAGHLPAARAGPVARRKARGEVHVERAAGGFEAGVDGVDRDALALQVGIAAHRARDGVVERQGLFRGVRDGNLQSQPTKRSDEGRDGAEEPRAAKRAWGLTGGHGSFHLRRPRRDH
jgi:hypothetical protein